MRIELTVPGSPIVVSDEPAVHGGLKDIEGAAHHKETEIEGVHRYAVVAIRQAFDAARRRLEDFAREQRGAVKMHDVSGRLGGRRPALSRANGGRPMMTHLEDAQPRHDPLAEIEQQLISAYVAGAGHELAQLLTSLPPN